MEKALKELAGAIARWTDRSEIYETSVPGLTLFRHEAPTEPKSGLYEPSVCVITQGAKRVLLAGDDFVYNARHYLITSLHLPTVVQIIEASAEKPCLGLVLKLDLGEISQMMVEGNLPAPRTQPTSRGMAVGEMTPSLLGAFQRLVTLLDEGEHLPVLAPLYRREITYRLLVGDQGVRLRQIASAGSATRQVAGAIEWLKRNFTQPLRVDDLAAKAGMSRSTFHHHFRRMTGMSPLQYQKQLRLIEAKRLMLTDHLDAAGAAFRVGYESPSQFSREYKRLFGAPPSRDVAGLRQRAAVPGDRRDGSAAA